MLSESWTTDLLVKDCAGTLYLYEGLYERIISSIFDCTQIHNYTHASYETVCAYSYEVVCAYSYEVVCAYSYEVVCAYSYEVVCAYSLLLAQARPTMMNHHTSYQGFFAGILYLKVVL